jgi:N6-L-threonylcarbamoyladenine synthase
MLLALETSCDETSVAVLDFAAFGREASVRQDFLKSDLIASQMTLHAAYGGVVPELAAREHLSNLPYLAMQAVREAGITAADISAVAVTRGPGLNGCLLVGMSFAKSLAIARKIPLLAIHHMEGHLFAVELAERRQRLLYPALALLVSGGHTELILIPEFRKYCTVARTRDDAVGEAFDKAASLLGLPYPGGPALSACAEHGDPKRFSFPIGMPGDDTAFSFSGVKTALRRAAETADRHPQTIADLAAAIQSSLIAALMRKTRSALDRFRPRSFILSGGVAANTLLREELAAETTARNIPFLVPPLRWCTDNAAMIGVTAARILEHDAEAYSAWKMVDGGRSSLGPHVPYSVGAAPRWSLDTCCDVYVS